MKCPICIETPLAKTNRQTVEIDHCPQCKGVWLDRGELDKLTERSGVVEATPSSSARPRTQPDFADSDFGHDHGERRGSHGQSKKSWLKDIFD